MSFGSHRASCCHENCAPLSITKSLRLPPSCQTIFPSVCLSGKWSRYFVLIPGSLRGHRSAQPNSNDRHPTRCWFRRQSTHPKIVYHQVWTAERPKPEWRAVVVQNQRARLPIDGNAGRGERVHEYQARGRPGFINIDGDFIWVQTRLADKVPHLRRVDDWVRGDIPRIGSIRHRAALRFAGRCVVIRSATGQRDNERQQCKPSDSRSGDLP